MFLSFKSHIRNWSIYFGTIIISCFAHELGHCVVAWSNGVNAVPTITKAYYQTAPSSSENVIFLGGPAGSILFTLVISTVFMIRKDKMNSAVFAGALAMPAMYCFLFWLKGRGHEGFEFQEAQTALGVSYSGHFMDWLFVTLFILGSLFWIITRAHSWKLVPKLVVGAVLTILFLHYLQDLNNKLFGPLFS